VPIAEDYLALLQAVNPFNDGGGRQADSSSQFGKPLCGRWPEARQNFAINIVNRRMHQCSQNGHLFVIICRVTRNIAEVSLNYEVNCPLAGYLFAELLQNPYLRDSRATAKTAMIPMMVS